MAHGLNQDFSGFERFKNQLDFGVQSASPEFIQSQLGEQGIPFQAYCFTTIGATRLEEGKVVKVWAR